MSAARRILNNLFYLLTGELISSSLAFLITIWLARNLSNEGYGYWALAQSILVYPLLLTELGLSTFGVREVARGEREPSLLIADIFLMRFLFAAFLFFLFLGGLFLFHISGELLVLFAGSALWLFVQAVNPEFLFQGTEKMLGVAVWRVATHLLYFLPVILFIHSRGDLALVPFLRFAGGLFPALLLLGYLNREYRWADKLSWNRDRMLGYLKTSVVMAGSLFVIKLYYTFDTIMLGAMISASAVGIYNAAYKVVLLFIGLATLAQAAFAPTFSRSLHDIETLNKSVKKYGLLLDFSATLFFGLTILLSRPLVMILFGADYAESATPLVLLSLSGYFVYLGTTFLSPLLYVNRQSLYLAAVSLGALTNVVLNILLIPRYGVAGAAWATVLSNIVIFFVAFFFYFRVSKRGGQMVRSVCHSVLFLALILFSNFAPDWPFLRAIGYSILVVLIYFAFHKRELVSGLKLLLNKNKAQAQ